MHYSKGEIVHTSRRVGPYQKYDWMILEFEGFESRKYKRDSLYSLERYKAMRMDTGEEKLIYIPVEFYLDQDASESVYKMRTDVPNDSAEVCAMFEDLEHWLANKRQLENKALDLRSCNHEERLSKIKVLLSGNVNSLLREGLCLHLIQKESPSIAGLNAYNCWKRNNPQYYKELIKLVYENTNSN